MHAVRGGMSWLVFCEKERKTDDGAVNVYDE